MTGKKAFYAMGMRDKALGKGFHLSLKWCKWARYAYCMGYHGW